MVYLQAHQYPQRLLHLIALHRGRGVDFLAHFGLQCPTCGDGWFPDLATEVEAWTIDPAQWTAADYLATACPHHADRFVLAAFPAP